MKDLLSWHGDEFRDSMMFDPPTWFKSLVFCEALVQSPFFPIAVNAFFKGGGKWIRTPAIVYSTHVATTLVPILYYPFPTEPHPGPQTDRYTLAVIYALYLLVPLLQLLTMLFRSVYNTQGGKGSAKAKEGERAQLRPRRRKGLS
nr:LOW QUALITY PROTEIN: sigma intracellular receptor 2 [Salvelinus alpinus]